MSEPVMDAASDAAAADQETKEGGRFARARRRPKKSSSGEAVAAQDSATSTSPRSASLSVPANRREIPITAFDFLAGAYASTIKARRAMYGVLAVLGLVAGYLVLGTFNARSEASQAQAQVDSLLAEQSALVASLGQVEGITVDQRLVIARQLELSDSFVRVAASQANLPKLTEILQTVQVPGVAISEVKLGALASSNSTAGSFDADRGAPITVLAQAVDLLSSATWADQVRALPGITDVTISQSGTSVTLTAYVPLGDPPVGMTERLLSLGIAYVKPDRAVSPSIPDANPSPSPTVAEEG